MTAEIVLASASVHRRMLLENAGIRFRPLASALDERALEAPLADVSADDVALILAEAKAADVAAGLPGAIVVGADQTLALGDERLHKPADIEAARRTLLKLSGRTHHLYSAVVILQEGAPAWRHVERAAITFRALSPAFVGRILAAAGEDALSSVGAYRIECEGIQLVERIEGDFFSIVGLPLVPLLGELRRRGAIDG